MRFFHQFVNGVVRECPESEIYLDDEGCVLGNQTTCERFFPTPIESTSSTVPTPPTPIEQVCDGITLGFIPNPIDCTSFVLCIFGVPEFLTCPSQTPVFDANREICVAGNPLTCEIFGNK